MKSVARLWNFDHLLAAFAGCFCTRGSFENFSTLVRGWILCPGRRSLSRIWQAGGGLWGEKHHATLYRLLSRAKWDLDALGKVLFGLLLSLLPKDIEVLVDDTLSRKSGPHVFGAGVHYDAMLSNSGTGTGTKRSKKQVRFAFGHSWVTLAVWVPLPWGNGRGLAIPVLFRLYRSKRTCESSQYRKRSDLAAALVQILVPWVPKERSLYLIGDCEYSCRTVVRSLPRNVHFVGPVLMRAALHEPPAWQPLRGRPRLKGPRIGTPAELASRRGWKRTRLPIYGKSVPLLLKTCRCLWPSVAADRLVRLVITRDPKGRIEDRAYFCTEPNLSAEQILIRFSHRWTLEVSYRNCKQLLGLGQAQNGWWRRRHGTTDPGRKLGPTAHPQRGPKAAGRTVPLGFLSYGLVVLWYLHHGQPQLDVQEVRASSPWYRHKHYPSFLDMLVALRRQLWSLRFSADPLLSRIGRKIRLVFPRWLLAG